MIWSKSPAHGLDLARYALQEPVYSQGVYDDEQRSEMKHSLDFIKTSSTYIIISIMMPTQNLTEMNLCRAHQAGCNGNLMIITVVLVSRLGPGHPPQR